MAISSVGEVGTSGWGSTTSSTSWTISGCTASVDDEIIASIAIDNYQTTFGYYHDVASVADSAGNVWAALNDGSNNAAYTYSPTSSQNDGATIVLFKTKVTNALSSGTITVTLNHARTAKAASLWRFTVGAGNTLKCVSGKNIGEGRTVDERETLASLSVSGLASAQYLFFRASAIETSNIDYPTYTSGYSSISPRQADAGTDSTSMTVGGEFRIQTTTSSTSSPISNFSGGKDCSSIMVALSESPITPDSTGGMMLGMSF